MKLNEIEVDVLEITQRMVRLSSRMTLEMDF